MHLHLYSLQHIFAHIRRRDQRSSIISLSQN
ncbi:hypothetical protein AB6A40_005391 [Gnathostoma spinigerum]|uniref:Uncharacterized protein n=1 Tax=Gnathostoma spinigerum TaxID=75299 RepID=A0ABD6EQ54_9BILA